MGRPGLRWAEESRRGETHAIWTELEDSRPCPGSAAGCFFVKMSIYREYSSLIRGRFVKKRN